jgi:two-component system sensor histidine kinase/response regulator
MSPKFVSATAPSAPVLPLVLIAEDEEQIAEIVSFIVRDAGYMPLVACEGQQALDLARTRRPALLITDLMLPLLDGKAVIAALRADAAAGGEPAPPIILMTAAGLAYARAADADVVLHKPFHLDTLEALLLRFLGAPPAPATDVRRDGVGG